MSEEPYYTVLVTRIAPDLSEEHFEFGGYAELQELLDAIAEEAAKRGWLARARFEVRWQAEYDPVTGGAAEWPNAGWYVHDHDAGGIDQQHYGYCRTKAEADVELLRRRG